MKRSGAIHEVLGSDGEEESIGNGLASIREISRAIHEPHESLRKDAQEPLRGGLFGRFHERFVRRDFFFAGRAFALGCTA